VPTQKCETLRHQTHSAEMSRVRSVRTPPVPTRVGVRSASVHHYMADLDDEVRQHQVEMHSSTDDTQLYLYCCRDATSAAVARLETCLTGVSTSMLPTRLKLNAEETELMWAGSKFSAEAQLGNGPSVQTGSETVFTSDLVHDNCV